MTSLTVAEDASVSYDSACSRQATFGELPSEQREISHVHISRVQDAKLAA